MGPAFNAGAEVMNHVFRTYLLIGTGAFLVIVGMLLAGDRVRSLRRRRRARARKDDLCSAFAEAVALGDLDGAEAIAAVAFMQPGVGSASNRGAGVR